MGELPSCIGSYLCLVPPVSLWHKYFSGSITCVKRYVLCCFSYAECVVCILGFSFIWCVLFRHVKILLVYKLVLVRICYVLIFLGIVWCIVRILLYVFCRLIGIYEICVPVYSLIVYSTYYVVLDSCSIILKLFLLFQVLSSKLVCMYLFLCPSNDVMVWSLFIGIFSFASIVLWCIVYMVNPLGMFDLALWRMVLYLVDYVVCSKVPV